jgi:superfamily II DNA or RNA helicase
MVTARQITPGSIVRFRERDWIVIPGGDSDVLLLRPIGSTETDSIGVYLPLLDAGLEAMEEGQFPLPEPDRAADHVGGRLLHEATRLLLRDGAAPLRSLGRLSVRPRAYQFVPLVMALRLNPVRLLIADDVGVGKTIEALAIARELLDRGEIRRIGVLCPPYLCDQWQREMREKFHLDAAVVRPGTLGRLEHEVPANLSLFAYYPYFVASIDFVKSERYRPSFLQHCPELVIVDEAHGAAQPPGQHREQQLRHELLKAVASNPERHLLLLTATPHSGVEVSFRSLLGLLRPDFRDLDIERLSASQTGELARHFVQRRRADVERWIEETTFPQRESSEETYSLSPQYLQLFQDVYTFARDLVRKGDELGGRRRRLCYWSALSLLRSVMSSPAAAEAAFLSRLGEETKAESGEASLDVLEEAVFDYTEREAIEDSVPTAVLEETGAEVKELFSAAARTRLREFAQRAANLKNDAKAGMSGDAKVEKLVNIVGDVLREGFNPIVWCRFIPTADYVAEVLKARLSHRFPDLQVDSVTGTLPEETRRERVKALAESPRRVLVATDCLSEGVNLQDHFTAVIHYDLPWNPNRLEQREGRVDRFGQAAPVVKAILLYGSDNPVDGAVLEVLIRKARQIRAQLGVSVPVPEESTTVVEAILASLFQRWREPIQQLRFDAPEFLPEQAQEFLRQWERAVQRERSSRAKFAQRAIRPDDVQQELAETDAVLGDPAAVQRFVRRALARLGASAEERGDLWTIPYDRLPAAVREQVGDRPQTWKVTFRSPPPRELEGVEVVGRNHPLVVALAEYLLARALDPDDGSPPAARCGAIFTDDVDRLATLYLLRLRYLLREEQRPTPLLAEEAIVWGFEGTPEGSGVHSLTPDEALALLEKAEPSANIGPDERRQRVARAIEWWRLPEVAAGVQQVAEARAAKVAQAHRRIRRLARQPQVTVEPCLPPDLIGVYVLVPRPGRA